MARAPIGKAAAMELYAILGMTRMRHTLTVRTISSCAISVKKATSPNASPPPHRDLWRKLSPSSPLHLIHHVCSLVTMPDHAGISACSPFNGKSTSQDIPAATQGPVHNSMQETARAGQCKPQNPLIGGGLSDSSSKACISHLLTCIAEQLVKLWDLPGIAASDAVVTVDVNRQLLGGLLKPRLQDFTHPAHKDHELID